MCDKASFTCPGFRPACSFRLSLNKVVKRKKALDFSHNPVFRPADRPLATGAVHCCAQSPTAHTFTRSHFWPVAPSTAVSVAYREDKIILRLLWVVQMSDFELDVELVVICVVRFLFVLFYYCLCVNVYCHRVTYQLQLINISYHNISNSGGIQAYIVGRNGRLSTFF
jgi:hypothetical protein